MNDRPRRSSVEGLWDATRKTLNVAGFRAGQYKRVVQKKVDLASVHRKIVSAHAELGKFIDDCRERGDGEVLSREEVQALFRRLDGYKSTAALLEEEIETIKGELPPEDLPGG
jgi:hypothetical protein